MLHFPEAESLSGCQPTFHMKWGIFYAHILNTFFVRVQLRNLNFAYSKIVVKSVYIYIYLYIYIYIYPCACATVATSVLAVSHLRRLKNTSLSKKNVFYNARFPHGAIYIYMYIYIYVCVYINMYIYICICIYIYI